MAFPGQPRTAVSRRQFQYEPDPFYAARLRPEKPLAMIGVEAPCRLLFTSMHEAAYQKLQPLKVFAAPVLKSWLGSFEDGYDGGIRMRFFD